MNVFRQPAIALCLATLVLVFLIGNGTLRAESRAPSIAESGRTQVARLVHAEAVSSVVPPNYPQSFAGPVPTSKLGRQIVGGTAGGIGGLFAGVLIGVGVERASGCAGQEDCGLRGLMIGAPVGAIAGAIAGATLAK
jgi:hypothetical protein